MSLDQNLFTLNITPRANEPHVVELIDPQETVHYRKERVDGSTYAFNVFDPMSESMLATVSAPSATSKHKTIELHNPSVPVELKYSGTFTFRWTFFWEEHEFEWKREECHMIRKPDPPVLVAIAKEPPGRIKTKAVQILDYNLNRFEIQDRKGLEIVLLSALLSFADYSDDYHAGRREESASSSSSLSNVRSQDLAKAVGFKPASRERDFVPAPPDPPPKPKKTGAELIADMQKGELNEILIAPGGDPNDYAEYCSNLLEGDTVLFVVLRSSAPETVPKVLQVAHLTKRLRHKAGMDDELHQYVQYDTAAATPSGKKGPRVIKLDDDAAEKDRYKPPENLTIHLSKIPMPELQPKAKSRQTSATQELYDPKDKSSGKGKDKADEKERKRREKEEEKERKEREKREKKEKGKKRADSPIHDDPRTSRPAARSDGSRLSKKPAQSPPRTHIPAHQVHPHQPSPSPSQLNNPAIYGAPPPMPPRPFPQPSPGPGLYPAYVPAQQRPPFSDPPPSNTSPYGPGPYSPPQRPVSAYGSHLGPPPPQMMMPIGQRPTTPSSLVNGLLDKLKTW